MYRGRISDWIALCDGCVVRPDVAELLKAPGAVAVTDLEGAVAPGAMPVRRAPVLRLVPPPPARPAPKAPVVAPPSHPGVNMPKGHPRGPLVRRAVFDPNLCNVEGCAVAPKPGKRGLCGACHALGLSRGQIDEVALPSRRASGDGTFAPTADAPPAVEVVRAAVLATPPETDQPAPPAPNPTTALSWAASVPDPIVYVPARGAAPLVLDTQPLPEGAGVAYRHLRAMFTDLLGTLGLGQVDPTLVSNEDWKAVLDQVRQRVLDPLGVVDAGEVDEGEMELKELGTHLAGRLDAANCLRQWPASPPSIVTLSWPSPEGGADTLSVRVEGEPFWFHLVLARRMSAVAGRTLAEIGRLLEREARGAVLELADEVGRG